MNDELIKHICERFGSAFEGEDEDIVIWFKHNGDGAKSVRENANEFMQIHLKMSAMLSCEHRGHNMTKFTGSNQEMVWSADCLDCGKSVVVRVDPRPNETFISGAAVAVGCED